MSNKVVKINKINKIKKILHQTVIVYLIIILMIGSFSSIVHSNPADPWWNTKWNYRKEITIYHSVVDVDLTNFPVLIDITSQDLKNHAQSNANDIVFTNQSGGRIYRYEIESYDATNGHLIAWVNITHLSSITDNILYLYYGNSTCGPQQNITGTWNGAFNGVYHLKETWDTSAGHFKDSTVNHQDGTLTDANANSTSDNGIVGKGFHFNGGSVADYINIGVINHNSPITYSCWVKADTLTPSRCALGRYYGGYYMGTSSVSGGMLREQILVNNNWGYYNWRSGVSSNVWYLMTVTYDGSTIRYYTNGAQDTSTAVTGSLSSTPYPWHIGDDGSAEMCFKGVVDEVRIASTCLSSGWISTYYRNVNNPSSFYVVGAEETQGIYSLTLTTSGTGSGTIQVSPAGPYTNGTIVTIWANASTGSTFTGFSGSLTGTTTPQTLVMNGNKAVNAAFTLNGGYTLTLTTSGTGTGTIQASPAGPYYYGTVVTIWANASTGSTFTGFTGNLTGTTTPQTFTIHGNANVNAQFTRNGPYTLTLTTSGTGTGTIQASPAGPYYYGTVVTIWANASTGSSFTGFTGNLTGTTTPQTFTIHGNSNVNAAFILNNNGSGNWWNTKWLYRKQITIPHTMVNQNFTNFPVLIDITSQDLKNHAQSNANDIVFTNQSGGRIYRYEVESYNASNGRLIAWVNITQLSSTTDNILYVYYGNSTCGPQQNITGTWNGAFNGVYHLKETWGTGTGHFKDSTVNHQDGTLTDANANSTSDNGIVGKGFHFNGGSVADYINIGVINHNYPITYSCWLKADTLTPSRCALGRYYGGYYLGTSSASGGMLREQILVNNNWGYYNWRSGVSSNVWYLMTVTYDGSTIRYYTNGVQDTSTPATGSLSSTPYSWHIGDDGSAEMCFKGVIDEVRIASTCLPSGWISTYYRNVNNPASFYTVGSEETQNQQNHLPQLSSASPSNVVINVPVKPLQLTITVQDADGNLMNITFRTNASGIWKNIGINASRPNGTYSQAYYFGKSDQQYWWSVNCSDGTGWTNQTFTFTIKPINLGDTLSPLQKYFNTKKVVWSLDDYRFDLNDYPPHKGFDNVSREITSYGGNVDIMTILTTESLTHPYGNAIRNYSFVSEFGISQNRINRSLQFFQRKNIYPEAHAWNASPDLNNKATLARAYKIINYTFWNWKNNFNIQPTIFLGESTSGNYNITLALKKFSQQYWNVYGQNFRWYNSSLFPTPSRDAPAVQYTEKAVYSTEFDPLFGMSWGTPCKNLSAAQALFNQSYNDSSLEVLLIRGHPELLNNTNQKQNLTLWLNWIDWIYQKHKLINVNDTQIIQYTLDRNNYKIKRNSEFNFTIDLTNCLYSHFLLFSNPYNGTNIIWKIVAKNGKIIGYVHNDTYLTLAPGTSYYMVLSIISNPQPANGLNNVNITPVLSADILNPKYDATSWQIRSNASGSWKMLEHGTLAGGKGTVSTSNTTSMNQYNTRYWWSVNCKNGTSWTNETYSFKTISRTSYTLTLTTSGTGSGTIQASPSGPYYYGAVVTVWANASGSSTFTGFTGNLTGATTPQALTIYGNASVNAVFMSNGPYILTLTKSGTGNGTIQASSGPYNYGTVVTVWANASSGSVFAGFNGNLTGITTPQTLTIHGTTNINAAFMLNGPYILTLTQNGTGWGTIEANNNGPFTYGATVTIWANASTGSTFTGFTGNLTGTTTPQTLTIHGTTSVNAQFTRNGPYTLTLTKSGTGTGTIQASPSGPYFYGDDVTIWANSSSFRSIFTGFTGNLTGITTPQTLIIHGNANVNAIFTQNNPGPSNWWNTKWLYRKQITIPHTMIDQNFTNFPVLINITSLDLKNHAQSNANDIVFTNQSGGRIYRYEIESYNASNGRLIAWVNITQLSSTTDNILYLYYGNSTCGPQQNITGTWNGAFNGVYHLKETWGTGTGHFKDSTVNHQDGTLTDANASSTSVTGIVGKGFHFSGDADFINIGVINHNSPITYSCWVKADTLALSRCALGRYYGGYYLGTSSTSGGMLREQILVNNNWGYYNWRSGVSSNVWYLMTVTYDGSTIRYYTNGAQDTSTAVTGSLSSTTYPWHIGDDGSAELFFKGVVDEVRIASTCLSSSWISTYYRNVNSPSTFYTIGNEETQSGVPPVISTIYPANASINIAFNPQLQANVYDADGDVINCTLSTNASGTWQILASNTFLTGSGTIIGTSTYMHSPLVKYWWSVHCTDGLYWANKTYWFKTGVDQPVVLDATPHNNIIATYNPRLSVNAVDYQNKLLTVKFRRINGTAWQDLGTYIGYSGLFTQNTTFMNVTNQTYHWSYNVTDGTTWVNGTNSFQVQAFVLKWVNYDVPFNSVGPVAADVNNDGIYEIFQVGQGKVICVNGSNGNTIWTYTDNQIAQHSIAAIADLNHDGIPEIVIACDESKAGIVGKTLALHANNGSLYWRVDVPSDHRHFIIADTDGTGYPYVYVVAHVEHGWISKLRGTDGKVLAQTRVYYPCHGGLSMADLDNDGHLELILADYNGEPGKGIQCYDADTLKLKWYVRNRGDPQIGILADVNKDGVLDVTTAQYSDGPIQVINGATASNINGYSGLTSPSHSPLTIYDIDRDGNLEALDCSDSLVKVFDLYTKSLDTTLPTSADEPPFMADVIGDKNLEIIAANYKQIDIYNKNYQKVGTIPIGAERWTLVQDIDNDGQNELVTDTGGDGILRAYDTSAYTPIPQVRTGMYGYSEKATGAGVYTPPPGAPQPILKQEAPVNGSRDVLLNPTLSVHAVEYQVHVLSHNHIVDYQYDKMKITVSTNASATWQNITSFTNAGNAQYNITTTNMNHPDTTYYWRVTATDINPQANNITSVKTYHFRTKSAPKIRSVSISPTTPYQRQNVTFTANITEDVHMDVTQLRITGPSGFTPVNATVYKYQWTPLTHDDFEAGWGNYTSGGAYCSRYQQKTPTDDMSTWPLVPQGSWAADIQGNSMVASSFNLTHPIDIKTPGYNAIKVDFWMNAYGMGDGYQYYLEYFNGTQWVIRKTYTQNSGSFDPSVYTDSNYKFANWINFHDSVWINKSTYNFPTNMNIRFRCVSGSGGNNVYIDQIYINATVVQPTLYSTKVSFAVLGLYHYSFWCKDVNGNANTSATYNFTVIADTSPPQITAVTSTPSSGYQGTPINVSCSAQDNVGLQDVRAVITDPSANTNNYSIIANKVSPNTYYLTQTYATVGTYQYHIWAKDVNGNTNSSSAHQFTVIADTNPPQITAVTATPSSGYQGTPINVSCSAQDNVGLQDVRAVITDPSANTNNYSIIANKVSPNTYYLTQTYTTVGTYQFHIWAKDVNGNTAVSATYSFTISTLPKLTDWQYRKQITISHSQVSTNLSNFPVLVDIRNDNDLATKAQDNFNDVLFTNASVSWQTGYPSDRLAHEIESCNGVTGNLTVWVKIPSLSSTQDTILYMYYGNPQSGSQQQPTQVWSNSEVLVQHLNETSGTAYDSTSFNNDGTIQNSVNQTAIGRIDGANWFDGVSSLVHIQHSSSLDLGTTGTVSAWIKLTTYKNYGGIIHKGDLYSCSDQAYSLQLWSNNKVRFYITNSAGDHYIETTNTFGTNTWFYVVASWDASGWNLYVNGTLNVANSSAVTPRATTGGVNIGSQVTQSTYYPFKGTIDEVRISSVSRDSGWIHTSYVNQLNPSSFYSVGSEESH